MARGGPRSFTQISKLGSDTQQANALLIEFFSKMDQTHSFIPLRRTSQTTLVKLVYYWCLGRKCNGYVNIASYSYASLCKGCGGIEVYWDLECCEYCFWDLWFVVTVTGIHMQICKLWLVLIVSVNKIRWHKFSLQHHGSTLFCLLDVMEKAKVETDVQSARLQFRDPLDSLLFYSWQVMIFRLVTRGTIEERMMQMTKKKMVLEHLVVGRMKKEVINQVHSYRFCVELAIVTWLYYTSWWPLCCLQSMWSDSLMLTPIVSIWILFFEFQITIVGNRRRFHDFETILGRGFWIENKKNTKNYSMWLNKVICMGGTNQIGTNTCHHNKKLN